jgi:hypothetical protein
VPKRALARRTGVSVIFRRLLSAPLLPGCADASGERAYNYPVYKLKSGLGE